MCTRVSLGGNNTSTALARLGRLDDWMHCGFNARERVQKYRTNLYSRTQSTIRAIHSAANDGANDTLIDSGRSGDGVG